MQAISVRRGPPGPFRAGRRRGRALAMVLALALAGPGPLAAGALSDLLMAPGTLPQGAPGTVLARYAQDRHLPPPAAAPEGAPSRNLDGAVVTLTAMPPTGDAPPAVELARSEGGSPPQPLARFPASGPNPVLLYFLEGTVRAMAEATGGSPYYIRNRMREALAQAGAGEPAPAAGPGAREAVLTPFAADPNRDRMGAFAGLTLRLLHAGDPPRLLRLSADTGSAPEGYHDEMRLVEE